MNTTHHSFSLSFSLCVSFLLFLLHRAHRLVLFKKYIYMNINPISLLQRFHIHYCNEVIFMYFDTSHLLFEVKRESKLHTIIAFSFLCAFSLKKFPFVNARFSRLTFYSANHTRTCACLIL